MKIMNKLRINRGLHWRGKYPGWKEVGPTVLGIILGVLLGLSSYGISLSMEISEAKQESKVIASMFNDFLKGGTLVSEDEKFAARCENLIEVVN